MKLERTISTVVEVTFAELVKALVLPDGSEVQNVLVVEDALRIRLKDNKVAKDLSKKVDEVVTPTPRVEDTNAVDSTK